MDPSSDSYEEFRTTHWSRVLEAGEVHRPGSNQALEELYLAYWKPIYTYLRRRGNQPQDCQDLVQGFFLHLLERREFFLKADQHRGKFRSFLLGALKNFLSDVKAREAALKRGGGVPHLSLSYEGVEEWIGDPSKEDAMEEFDRRWAMTVLEQTLARLKSQAELQGRSREYQAVFSYISGKTGATPPGTLASELGITEGAFKMKASRLRKTLGQTIREVVAETVSGPAEVADEVAYLKQLMKKIL
jgi:DNA-directed RNA polymerase specialized sigma24 family protein